jgi:uncharacterized protein YndB with AHSA1/START domain
MEVAMNEFEVVIAIDRPVDDVFAFLVDPSKTADWTPGVTEARRTSEGPVGVGTTVLFTGRFLGRGFESVSEVTAFVPGQKFTSKSISGPIHLEVDSTLQPVDGGTRLATVYRGESRGFFKLAEPVIVRLTKKHFETAAENLKALLEADSPPAA